MPLWYSTNNKTANRKNWIAVTDQWSILVMGDFDRKFAVILLTYSKIIHEPKPYPTNTVNVKRRISESLSMYNIWRVANKSKITRTTIDEEITMGIFLLPIEKPLVKRACIYILKSFKWLYILKAFAFNKKMSLLKDTMAKRTNFNLCIKQTSLKFNITVKFIPPTEGPTISIGIHFNSAFFIHGKSYRIRNVFVAQY